MNKHRLHVLLPVVMNGKSNAVLYETPSYANAGGTGDRTASIIVTSTLNWSDVVSKFVDGITTPQIYSNSSSLNVVGEVLVKFQFSAAVLITEIKLLTGSAGMATLGTHKVQGSLDDAVWVDLSGNVVCGGAGVTTQTVPLTNAIGYTYYRFFGVSGSIIADSYIDEFEFKIGNLL